MSDPTPKPYYDPTEVKAKIPMVDLVKKALGDPNKDGAWRCPFHEERTGSFKLARNNQAHCFGCGWHGTVIDFHAALNDISFKEALQQLGEGAHLAPSAHRPLIPPPTSRRELETPLILNETDRQMMRSSCLDLLRATCSDLILKELPLHQQRKIVELIDFFKNRGWTQVAVQQLADEGALGVDDQMRALLFGFSYGVKKRADMMDSRTSRWIAGKARYNCWREQSLLPSHENLFVFEGETDTVAAMSARPEPPTDHYVGIPGASWSPTEMLAAKLFMDRNVYIALDNDAAGQAGTLRLLSRAKAAGARAVYYFDWRDRKINDIGELLIKDGPEDTRIYLESSWLPAR